LACIEPDAAAVMAPVERERHVVADAVPAEDVPALGAAPQERAVADLFQRNRIRVRLLRGSALPEPLLVRLQLEPHAAARAADTGLEARPLEYLGAERGCVTACRTGQHELSSSGFVRAGCVVVRARRPGRRHSTRATSAVRSV